MKKAIFLFSLFLFTTLTSISQKTMDVKMTFTYKGAPLCFWDVTIKNGDVPLAKGKTDDKGYVEFSSVKLISLSINASGIKTTPNGEKKWDVNGYIALKENGECNFDFEPMLKETGMPVSMMEVAWGLTLNDCLKSSSSSSASNSGSQNTASQTVAKEETEEEKEAREEAEEKKEAADLAATQAQGMQNSKAMYENKVANLSSKIDKKKKELSTVAAGTKEESDLKYEIRLLEIDRDLNQVKLEKTNAMIAKGNMPLSKAEKTGFNEREDALKAEEDQLKADQKAGKMFGGMSVPEQQSVPQVDKKVEEPKIKTQEIKSTEKEAKESEKKEIEKKESEANEQKDENKESSKEMDTKEEEEEEFSIASADEMSAMSLVSLHKLNIRYNSMLTNRKVSLNAKAALLRPEKKAQLEKEVAELQVAIEQLDKEIASRKKE